MSGFERIGAAAKRVVRAYPLQAAGRWALRAHGAWSKAYDEHGADSPQEQAAWRRFQAAASEWKAQGGMRGPEIPNDFLEE